MATVVHNQRSDYSRVWFSLTPTQTNVGLSTETIEIPACNAAVEDDNIYVHDTKYTLAASGAQTVGTDPFRLWVEKNGASASYLLDTVLDGSIVPTSFGEGIGALLVAWRDFGETDAQYLHSIQI